MLGGGGWFGSARIKSFAFSKEKVEKVKMSIRKGNLDKSRMGSIQQDGRAQRYQKGTFNKIN